MKHGGVVAGAAIHVSVLPIPPSSVSFAADAVQRVFTTQPLDAFVGLPVQVI